MVWKISTRHVLLASDLVYRGMHDRPLSYDFLRSWQILFIGITIVCGHNLIGDFKLHSDSAFYIVWAMLYQREVIDLGAL